MPTVVPESARSAARTLLTQDLEEGLAALLEFTGAAAGWVGLTDDDGRLTFPVRRGRFPDAWLSLQQGRLALWGFGVREGPTLLNDLSPLHALGEPSLSNLLSCPVMREGVAHGHVVAANKQNGFTSHDAAVLQGVAHWMSHRLARQDGTPAEEGVASYLPCNVLNRISEGLFVLDDTGRLLWANAAWLGWTGFSLEELMGQVAPYPFWISHRVLALLGQRGEVPAPLPLEGEHQPPRPLPFRRRDDTIFWCQLEIVNQVTAGRRLVLALLRQTPSPTPPDALAVSTGQGSSSFGMPAGLPFAAALTDLTGRIVWANDHFFQQIAPASLALGASLHERFSGVSARAFQRLIGQAGAAPTGRLGRLVLRPIGRGNSGPLVAYWSSVSLTGGLGLIFGFSEDWAALGQPDDWATQAGAGFRRPDGESLVLLLTAGRDVAFWDERWRVRTGLTDRDLAGVPTEVVLDWLFPQQRDRDRVADLLHQPGRSGGQLVLNLLAPGGSQLAVCTFLSLPSPERNRWLLLAGDPYSLEEEGMPLAPMRSFLRGLGHLLNHYVLAPQSLAEAALDRGNLPPDVATAFEQILDRCQAIGLFLAALQDLAAAHPPVTEVFPLPDLVGEFLEECQLGEDRAAYELDVDLPAHGFMVRANRRMIKTVLRHLFTNARQALVPGKRPRIRFRVFADADAMGCSITDNGEGLPTDDWVQLLAPFTSNKGAFARDARHAALDAAGLGLTVSRHLLALHGGRLELRAHSDGGTSAVFFLPHCEPVAPRPRTQPNPETVSATPETAPGTNP